MNVGKTLFAQVMEFVPWKSFGRIIERHRGDSGVRTLAEHMKTASQGAVAMVRISAKSTTSSLLDVA